MSITAYRVFADNDVLTAADLNLSFAQIINNPIALWSPATTNASFDGNTLYFDGSNTIGLASGTAALNLTGAALNTPQGTDIASAATINLDTATGNIVDVTGTVTITAVTLSQGRWRLVRFTGALLLTNGASLVISGGANITTVAGDYALFMGYSSSIVRVVHFPVTVTGSGAGVRATAPTITSAVLVTPALGVATGTQLTISAQPSFAGTNGSTVTGTVSTTAHTTFTERHDKGSNFANSTGIFTAPIAGVYQFSAQIDVTNTSSTASSLMDITGSTVGAIAQARTPNPGISGTVYTLVLAGDAQLALNETVTLRTTLGATSQSAAAIRFCGSLAN